MCLSMRMAGNIELTLLHNVKAHVSTWWLTTIVLKPALKFQNSLFPNESRKNMKTPREGGGSLATRYGVLRRGRRDSR